MTSRPTPVKSLATTASAVAAVAVERRAERLQSLALHHLVFALLAAVLLIAAAADAAQQPAGGDAGAKMREKLLDIDAALRAWDLDRADELLRGVDGSTPAARTRRGLLKAQRGDLQGAHDELSQLTAQHGGHAAAWNALGEVRIWREQQGPADEAFRRAEQAAQQATNAKGDDGDAWLQLGIARQRLKKYDPAAEALRKARQHQADETEVRYQLGRTFTFKEDWRAAVDALNGAVERQKSLAYAYFYRGVAFRRLGENGRMVEDLERFVALAPKAPDAERARRLIQAARR